MLPASRIIKCGGNVLYCWLTTINVPPTRKHYLLNTSGKQLNKFKGTYISAIRDGRQAWLHKISPKHE